MSSIVFIDSQVSDYHTIIQSLPVGSEYVVLNPRENGVEQIAQRLAQHHGLEAVHIISHALSGQLQLGPTVLTVQNLSLYQSAWATIGASLNSTGDLLLYGCDLAQAETGAQFINQLAQLTGADVSASNDLTGVTGNWLLESATGSIETPAYSLDYNGNLALTYSVSQASFPGHTLGEFRNGAAFSAIRADGSVIAWGNSNFGGINGIVPGLQNAVQIFSTDNAFAALRSDGTVVAWGGSGYSGDGLNHGGDASAVQSALTNVVHIFSNSLAFAALKADGSVVTWGYPDYGGNSSAVSANLNSVKQVFSNSSSFAALRENGSVITWGVPATGGDSSSVNSLLTNNTNKVSKVYSTNSAFAALREDGTVVTWGDSNFGIVNGTVQGLSDAVQVFSTSTAFAALRANGSVVTWGNSSAGGDSSAVAANLSNVQQIVSTRAAFAAIRADGTVITWGDANYGANSSSVNAGLANSNNKVVNIYATDSAFAALLEDGSVVTWGDSTGGGNSSSVQAGLNGLVDVKQIFTTGSAFAALRSDGSVVTWGGDGSGSFINTNFNYGGDSSAVASKLTGHVTQITSTQIGFSALRDDGSVVTWGAEGANNNATIDTLLSTNIVGLAEINRSFIADNASVGLNEDRAYAFSAADFNFSSAFYTDSLQSVMVTSLPGTGSLSLNGQSVQLNQVISVADLNAHKLIFTPALNTYGNNYANFNFKVSDGVVTSATYQMALNVNSVNDLPTASNQTVTIDEDNSKVFTLADFGFQDADAGDSLQAVALIAPTAGTLKLNNEVIPVPPANISLTLENLSQYGRIATAQDILDGHLIFQPAANANGSAYASFQYLVSDGIERSRNGYTMTVNVNPVYDPATPKDVNLRFQGSKDIILTLANFGITDLNSDGGPEINLKFVSGFPLGGLPSTFKAIDLKNGHVSFYPEKKLDTLYSFMVKDGLDHSPEYKLHIIDNNKPRIIKEVSLITMSSDSNTKTLAVSDFSFSDRDAGDSLQEVMIDWRSDYASLTLDNVAVTTNQIIQRSDIEAGKLSLKVDRSHIGTFCTIYYFVSDGESFSLLDGALVLKLDNSKPQTPIISDVVLGSANSTSLNNSPLHGNGILSPNALNAITNEVFSFALPNSAFVDPDGDILTYQVNGALPGGLSFNPDTRIFTGSNLNIGNYTISITASDGKESSSNSFNLLIKNAVSANAKGQFVGSAAADYIQGKLVGSSDPMAGGKGDDSYVVDNLKDKVTESKGSGTDTVMSSVNFKLGENIENLLLQGKASGHTKGIGNKIANVLFGDDGDNILDGGLGIDSYIGGLGNDTFILDNLAETNITEYANESNDSIQLKVDKNGSYTLPENIELLTITGKGVINLQGNDLDNMLIANAKNNTLVGGYGNDILQGLAGNDVLQGNSGADWLIGGLGKDTLTGGNGADMFVFNAKPSASNTDKITDFVSGVDKIKPDNTIFSKLKNDVDLSDNFIIGSKSLDRNDYLQYDSSNGNLYYDADGTGKSAHVLIGVVLDGNNQPAILSASDFV